MTLQIRKNLKSKKPNFIRQDAHKKAKLPSNWRKPRGLQSKMRLKFKGYRRSISIGWKSPVEVRGLNSKGLKDISVNNVKQLESVGAKDSVLIPSNVGLKKKIAILQEAIKKKLNISNVKDPEKYIEQKTKELSTRKAEKEKKRKKKSAKQEKKSEKDKKTENQESEKTAEQKKAQEKKEKDKLLMHGK
jgi:large subunit ribosomal protein L32e